MFKSNEADHIFPAERWGILPFNQLCLLATMLITYLWAKQLFDARVAAMVGWLMLFSDAAVVVRRVGIADKPADAAVVAGDVLFVLCR